MGKVMGFCNDDLGLIPVKNYMSHFFDIRKGSDQLCTRKLLIDGKIEALEWVPLNAQCLVAIAAVLMAL